MSNSIQHWIEAAKDDLEAAGDLYKSGRWSYVCFLCHQSIEKMLKAAVMKNTSTPAPPSHNLGYLLQQTGIVFPNEIVNAILRVAPHYLSSRYPDSAGGRPSQNYNESIAREILDCTEVAYSWLVQHLT